MSAWICTSTHFAAVAATFYRYAVAMGDEPEVHDPAERTAKLVRTAEMLAAENCESVGYCYRHRDDVDTEPPPISSEMIEHFLAHPLPMVVFAKATVSLDYQSCEHPGWVGSRAHALCREAVALACGSLGVSGPDALDSHPDYDGADGWGIPDGYDGCPLPPEATEPTKADEPEEQPDNVVAFPKAEPEPEPEQPRVYFDWTHAYQRPDGSWYAFNVEECEVCGRACEAPNPIVIRGTTEAHLRGRGVTIVDAEYPTLWACEARGGIAVCPECYVEEGDEPTSEPEPEEPTSEPEAQPEPEDDDTPPVDRPLNPRTGFPALTLSGIE